MQVTVVGSGNGGMAVGFEWAQHGHPVASSGTDLAAAIDGAEVVFVVGPAFATEDFGRALAPHLRAGMTVVICPGSCAGRGA